MSVVVSISGHIHSEPDSSRSPVLNGTLHYPAPADIDKLLNEAAAVKKIRDYRADYNIRPSNSISFIPAVANVLALCFSPHQH
jgi:hypothetical protein